MFSRKTFRRTSRKAQAGYMLLAIILLSTLLAVALLAAAPRVVQEIRRDREEELVQRANQYVRAIRLYYRKFGRYPANLEQLENTNNVRFLRKRYKDPLTGKDDWQLIHFGDLATNRTTDPFGNPISGSGSSATGGSGTSSAFGNQIGSAFGQAGAAFGSSNSQSQIPQSSIGTTGPTTGGGPAASATAATNTASQGNGNTLQIIGGAGIIGVSIPNTQEGIKEFKEKKHYNEWQFVYDPTTEILQRQPTAPGGAQGPAPMQGFGNAQNSVFGSGQSVFGSSPLGTPGTDQAPQNNSNPGQGTAQQVPLP